MNVNESVIGILCTAVFFLLIIVIALCWKSFQQSESLKRHERSVRRLVQGRQENKNNETSLNNIENDVNAILQETKGFSHFCKYACWVIIPICLIATIHHLVVFFPRILNSQACEQGQSGSTHLGVDYLGIIVAMFAIIITILVTWNIYSTIKAKEELRVAKEDLEKRLESRIKKLESCCKQRRNKLNELEHKHNALEQDADKRIRNIRANILRLNGVTWSVSLIGYSNPARFRRMINSFINSMNEHMQNKEVEQAGLILSYILEHADRIKSAVSISNDDKNRIINRFMEIVNYSDIDKAEDFIEFISSMPES